MNTAAKINELADEIDRSMELAQHAMKKSDWLEVQSQCDRIIRRAQCLQIIDKQSQTFEEAPAHPPTCLPAHHIGQRQ